MEKMAICHAPLRLEALPPAADKSHHVGGDPPTSFHNPWPSFPSSHAGVGSLLRTRFWDKRPPFAPIPADRSELVQVRRPDFDLSPPSLSSPSSSSSSSSSWFKVIWIGHASFLIQCYFRGRARSVNILFDPVFSERTSPVSFMGPKRYTPTPCALSELLDAVPIDVVCISHNHYDHADVATLKEIYEHRLRRGQKLLFCVALGNARWLTPLGISSDHIWEADWWERIMVPLADPDSSPRASAEPDSTNGSQFGIRIVCTPSQHASNRGIFDRNSDLWCSWVLELMDDEEPPSQELSSPRSETTTTAAVKIDSDTERLRSLRRTKALFFAGDTGYRTVFTSSTGNDNNQIAGDTSQRGYSTTNTDHVATEEEPKQMSAPCPEFSLIGQTLGPFDIALLPIGLNRPRHLMSPVHANATDSMDIHDDIRSRRSIGMHWGTVRGGLSAYYEDVKDPPLEWEREANLRRKKWRDRASKRANSGGENGASVNADTDESPDGWEIGLLDVGESLFI